MHVIMCKINECPNTHYALGYCKKHYKRFKKWGDPNILKQEVNHMSRTKIYHTWANMKNRCYDKNSKFYHRYGGRGITVCKKWNESFLAFYNDMGEKPFKNAQIDRINNDGDYEPSNCRWVTPRVNTQNRSNKVDLKIANEIRFWYSTGLFTYKNLDNIFKLHHGCTGFIVRNQICTS
jgi:hypothetical protein